MAENETKTDEVVEVAEDGKKSTGKTYHLSKRADGKWQVKYAGGEKVIKLFDTQKEALEYTKVMAANQNRAILIHKSKGDNKGKVRSTGVSSTKTPSKKSGK